MSSVISTHTDIKHMPPTVPARANYQMKFSRPFALKLLVLMPLKRNLSIYEGNNKKFFLKLQKMKGKRPIKYEQF